MSLRDTEIRKVEAMFAELAATFPNINLEALGEPALDSLYDAAEVLLSHVREFSGIDN